MLSMQWAIQAKMLLRLKSIHPCGRFWKSAPQGSVRFQLPYLLCDSKIRFITEGISGHLHLIQMYQMSQSAWNLHSPCQRCFLNLTCGCVEFNQSYVCVACRTTCCIVCRCINCLVHCFRKKTRIKFVENIRLKCSKC